MNRITLIATVATLLASISCAPTGIRIVKPADGEVVSKPTTIEMRIDGDPESVGSILVETDHARVGIVKRADVFNDPVTIAWTPPTSTPGQVQLTATALDLSGNQIAQSSVNVIVQQGITLPGSEGEGAAEGEGSVVASEGEGEGSVAGEGEGATSVGEGEGEGSTSSDGFVSPPARAFSQVTDFPAYTSDTGPNPGALNMYLYVPANMPEHAPVVVALHGCSQNASAFEQTSQWTQLADAQKFYVIFPEQNSENSAHKTGNPIGCFNWAGYYGAKMARGQGENESIKEMVDYVLNNDAYRADAHRVFATGLSAGAAMTALLLATWPDVFAAGAPMAGVPFDCATDVNGATACMHGDATKDVDAATWGDRVRAAGPSSFNGPWPRIQIWQGDADNTVNKRNGDELVKQWTNVQGTDQTVDDTAPLKPNAPKHSRAAYVKDGVSVVELITLHGMDHGISIDPGSGVDQGGGAGAYAYNEGVWSTYYAAKFFGIVDGSSSPPPPPSSGEGEGEGEGASDPNCVEYASTVVMHEYAIPPRVKNVGTLIAPSYVVIGSNEAIASSVNPYVDVVTLHSTANGFALGSCP